MTSKGLEVNISKARYFLNYPKKAWKSYGVKYLKINKKLLKTTLLWERYKKYPGRTLTMLVGMGIVLVDITNEYGGFGSPGYDLTEKVIMCAGLIACSFGFISPKIDMGDMDI